MWWSAVFVKRDFIPMAWNAKGQRLSLICLGLVVVVLNFFGQCTALTQTSSSKSSIVLGPHLKRNLNNGKEEQSTGAVRFGRLILGRNVKPRNESFATDEHAVSEVHSSNGSLDDEAGYQSDMGWESKQLGGHVYGTASPSSPVVESLLQMEPSVECVGDSMKLKVHDTASTPGSLFFVDRGNQSPLPLSQLPTSCGHSIRATRQDWIFIAIYNGCYVTLEDGNYVLPLRWWGLPIKMSCPAKKPSKPNPPTVSCYPEGMVVKMEGGTSAKDLRVKVKGHWQPLMRVSPQCGYSVVAHLEAVIISAHYEPCVETKDGMFTLELAGEGEVKVSCPGSVEQSFPRPNYPRNPVVPLPPTIVLQPSPMFPPLPTPSPKPQAQLHPYYTKPAEKPKPATLPPGNPQYYFSFYPQAAKPVTSSPPKDPQPPWYSESFYPQPVTPTPATLPPATEAPNGKVYYPYYHYPYDPQPAKPVTHPPVTQKPATEKLTSPLHPYYTEPATHPPVNPQYYFSFYPLPATPPPPTKVPQGHVQHPYYRHPKPVTGSPAKDPQISWDSFDPQPAKPATRPSVTQPTPAMLPPATEKPTAPLHPYYPKPESLPPGNHQYYFSFYPLPAKPVTPPPQEFTPATKAPQGHVQYPYYPHPLYPPHPKPVTGSPPKDPQIPWDSFDPQPAKPATRPVTQKPTPAVLPPATEKPTAPLHPYYQQFYPEPAKPFTVQLRPATQTPEQTPLVVHTWTPASPQPSHPRTTKAPPTVAPSTLPRPGDSYPPHPGFCPTICPTGFLTCCPMPISFHQHHHNHFGPVTSKDSDVIPAYPFKHTSDLFNYASVSGPTQATTPQPAAVQTVAPTKTSLTGFHDYWSQHGMRFSAALASYAQAPSDANKPSEPQRPKQSHFQPYNPQWPMDPYFEAPASDSNKPMAQQRPIQPYLPYNPQDPVQPHGQAPVYSNNPLELQRPASDPRKPSEPQLPSSDSNKPLKSQPSKWPHYPFRPPMWYDPDMFYASKPLMQPDHHQTQRSASAMQMHSTLEQLSPQAHPHGMPPRPVKELGGSLPSNSEAVSSFQQPNPSGQQMPTHYGSLPIYYAGSKPSYPQKPAAEPSGKPSRPEFPESFEHYWKPIVPLGSNQGFHVSYPAQSAGGSYPAQSAGGSYPAQSAGGSYPAQSAGGSYPAQSAGGSYPAQSAGGSYPAQSAGGSYPAQSAGGSYPAQSAGGSYPAQSAN